MDLFPPPAEWPTGKEPGLMFSWEGYAWVALQCGFAELELEGHVVDAILAKLVHELDKPAPPTCGEIVGSGALLTLAIVGSAMDPVRFTSLISQAERRVEASMSVTKPRFDAWDVVGGQAGLLLGLLPLRKIHEPRGLLKRLYAGVMDAAPRLLESERPVHLGFAHGIAGLMTALELGRHAGLGDGSGLAARCCDRLFDEAKVDEDKHLRWLVESGPVRDDGSFINGWCSGNPGIALATLLCHQATGSDTYAALAREAVAVIGEPAMSGGDILCCGSAGRAHILLEFVRRTHRAESQGYERELGVLSQTLPSDAELEELPGLFKGSLGRDYLRLRMAHPKLPFPAVGLLAATPA